MKRNSRPERSLFRQIAASTLACCLLCSAMTGCAVFDRGSTDSEGLLDSPTAGMKGIPETGYSLNAMEDDLYLPEPYDTEEYASIKENGFLSVAANPFSTFSADVDTASYCNLRRMLRSGVALKEVPRGAVRTEEMLNYFRYDYRSPKRGEPFGVTPCISTCPWNPDTKLLVLGLATEPADYAQTHGNNLVFLIDTSGSMDDPNKLGLLQKSFSYLVENLNDDDTVSIVTYAGSEELVLDGARADERDTILRAINQLRPDGSTNGQAGLKMAYETARKHFVEGGNNRIILASDGDLNVGITSESDLSDYVSEQRKSGVYLSVLGFGEDNYKDTKMETIADDGNGNYFYIDCIEEAERVFGENLCATLRTVADDVKLQVEFNPAYVKGYRLIGYENRSLSTSDFENDKVDAGDVGSGHAVTVAYELATVDSALEIPENESKYGSGSAAGIANGEWFTLSVRYKNPGESESKLLEYAIGDESVTDRPSDDWRFASAVIEFGMVANNSSHKGTASLEDVLAILNGLETQDDRRREFRKLVDLASW